MFLSRQNQYCENDYHSKHNLQVQCNPYQITKVFFTELEEKNHSLYRNTKDPEQPKQFWERRMELEESTFLTSDYTTKLQSSKQYGTGIETEIQANGTRQKAQKLTRAPMGALFLTKGQEFTIGQRQLLQ